METDRLSLDDWMFLTAVHSGNCCRLCVCVVVQVMEQKPLPLAGGEEAEYLLALKQEFRGAMRSLPCFIQPAAAHRGRRLQYTHVCLSLKPPVEGVRTGQNVLTTQKCPQYDGVKLKLVLTKAHR